VNDPHSEIRSAPRESFLKFSPPLIGEEEIAEVVDTLRSDWITTGPKTARFEEEFASYLGAPGALAVNSCTAGLHVALRRADVGAGDEVITTTITFAASVNVIEHVGARPVLVDVEADTLNLDPAAVEAAITSETRAIIAVHFAGHPAELDPIRELADRHDLILVEDAAHALPASYKGVRIGATSNPVAFSFYATKNLTTGEGGMLTSDPEFLERARCLSLHGMSRDAWRRYDAGGSWFYEVVAPGFKYNMTDIQASLGLWQLRKLEGFQERRRAIAAAYSKAFAATDALETPVSRPHIEHAWHLYVLRLRPGALRIGRDDFIRELAARNIGTSVHFIPIHIHPYYRDTYNLEAAAFPNAMESYGRMLSLPINPRMSDGDAGDVIQAVLDIVRAHER
jgi:dTDP-4-amino-4,6-dideoxygalactose transaminase